jgi:hypothetical protein
MGLMSTYFQTKFVYNLVHCLSKKGYIMAIGNYFVSMILISKFITDSQPVNKGIISISTSN